MSYCKDASSKFVYLLSEGPMQRADDSFRFTNEASPSKSKNLFRPLAGRKRFFPLHFRITAPLSGKCHPELLYNTIR